MSGEKVPWFVRRRLSPRQVRELLDRLMASGVRRPFYSTEEWERFLKRKCTGLLEKPSGSSKRVCLKCGTRLEEFLISRDKAVLKRLKDPRVRRLVTGYYCPLCIKTYFDISGPEPGKAVVA